MLKLPLGLGDLDFTDWARGIIAGFIQGGATAVTAAFVVAGDDPKHYAIGGAAFYAILWRVFAVAGTLGVFSFLRTRPLPDVKKVVTEKVIEQAGHPVKTETTTQTTTLEAPESKAP
jgi:hypothetical protein